MNVKIPILKIENILIASIQFALDDKSVVQFHNDLLESITKTGAIGVVIDITAVDLVDSFMARSLNDIAVASFLLGSQIVIVGMRPEVAITLVRMGLTVPNAKMALNLERGLDLLRNGNSSPLTGKSNGSGIREGAADKLNRGAPGAR